MIGGAWNHHPSLVLRNELLVMPDGKIKALGASAPGALNKLWLLLLKRATSLA